MNNLNWDDLRYFLAAAESGSLSCAAKLLNSNQPAVGRHIDALEAALNAYGDELAGLEENQWLLSQVPPDRIAVQSGSTTTRKLATEVGHGVSIQPRLTIAF